MKDDTQEGDGPATFKRLSTDQLKKLLNLVSAELGRREPNDVGTMSDDEFRSFVDKKLSKSKSTKTKEDNTNE